MAKTSKVMVRLEKRLRAVEAKLDQMMSMADPDYAPQEGADIEKLEAVIEELSESNAILREHNEKLAAEVEAAAEAIEEETLITEETEIYEEAEAEEEAKADAVEEN